MDFTGMGIGIEVRPVEEVPGDSRVVHYDELAEPVKERFPLLAEGERYRSDETVASALEDCDLVKYTEYYAVSTHP